MSLSFASARYSAYVTRLRATHLTERADLVEHRSAGRRSLGVIAAGGREKVKVEQHLQVRRLLLRLSRPDSGENQRGYHDRNRGNATTTATQHAGGSAA